MKRWGFAVAGLYLAALVVFSFPVTLAAFWPKFDTAKTLELYGAWPYWAWVAVMVLGEMLLLLVPIRIAEKRLKGRRSLAVPVLTSALLFALLAVLAVWDITLGIWGDEGPKVGPPEGTFWYVFSGVIVALWMAWGLVFLRYAKADAPETLMKRATTWLLRGSVLELLVAVPCHIAVRRRDDCCAPLGTLIGIGAGLAIMVMSFGPGVFVLFVERCRRLQPKGVSPTKPPIES